MKIRPVGAELLHADSRADGQADLTKLRVDFRSFAPENGIGFLKRMVLLACVSFLHPLRHAPT